MSTLQEIADNLGVSVATVSRALNDKPGVSSEMRQKVINLANEMHYHPNLAACKADRFVPHGIQGHREKRDRLLFTCA